MKKLITILFASLFSFSVAHSEGVIVGVTGSYVDASASGTESDISGASDTSARKADVDDQAVLGSLYAEYMLGYGWANEDNGVTIGVEYLPFAVNVSDKAFTRTDATSDANEDTQDDGDRTAQAEIENLMIGYIELPVSGPIYVRAGLAQMDVNTKETSTLSHASTYGNTTVDGTNLGFGVKSTMANGLAWKLSYEQTEFDTLSINSSQTDKGNKITADLDTSELSFSVGYKF